MKEVFLIASITFREALRRKVWLWVIIIVVGLVLIDWVFTLTPRDTRFSLANNADPRVMFAQYFGRALILFFASIIAVVLGASQITAELDRGVLATILPKPVSRLQVFLGKWLGIIACSDLVVVAAFMLNWVALALIYGLHSGVTFNVMTLGVMLLYPVLYGTLTMAWSSFANMVVALMLTATLYAVTWIGDTIVVAIARATQNEMLQKAQVLSTWVIPHARLSSWLSAVDVDFVTQMQGRLGMPSVCSLWDKTYVILYVVFFFAGSYFVFSKRDVQ